MIFNYQKSQIADREFGRATTPPPDYWLGYSSTKPNEDGTGITEPSTSGTGYGRMRLPNNKSSEGFSSAVNGIVSNLVERKFQDSDAPWGTLPHWVIWDSEIGGNPLYSNELDEALVIGTNNRIVIEIGAAQFQVANLP